MSKTIDELRREQIIYETFMRVCHNLGIENIERPGVN